jgi:hypothetical protein
MKSEKWKECSGFGSGYCGKVCDKDNTSISSFDKDKDAIIDCIKQKLYDFVNFYEVDIDVKIVSFKLAYSDGSSARIVKCDIKTTI